MSSNRVVLYKINSGGQSTYLASLNPVELFSTWIDQ